MATQHQKENVINLLKYEGDELKWHIYKQSCKDLAAFKTIHKTYESEMITAVMAIWKVYQPMKRMVSTNSSYGYQMRFHSVKAKGENIKLSLRNYWSGGGYGELYWVFPSYWLSLNNNDLKIQIQDMLDKEGIKYAAKKTAMVKHNAAVKEKADRKLYLELKEKFND